MLKRTNTCLVVLLLVTQLLTVGCQGDQAHSATGDELKGTITVSGAWALYPLMVQWSEEFQALHPHVKFDISAGGAGKGMTDVLAGAVDIGMVSREIYPQEAEKGAFWVSVAQDAVCVTVNAKNPVWQELRQQGLDQQTLVGMFVTGEINTWGQAVGRPEIDDPIQVFTRSDACGAAATWAAYLGYEQEDLKGIGVYGDPGVLAAVIKAPLGIGYNNLNFAFDFESGQPVKGALVVPLDVNSNGQADPNEMFDRKEQAIDAITDGAYPSPPARDLNLVVRGKPDGLVKIFLTWVLTQGQEYVDQVGYVSLPANKLQAESEKLD